jgi:hypothetical protein
MVIILIDVLLDDETFIIGPSAAGHSFSWLFIICFAAMVPMLAWFIERVEGEARRIGVLLARRRRQAQLEHAAAERIAIEGVVCAIVAGCILVHRQHRRVWSNFL